MRGYAVIEAPSVLGLFPHGVELLPEALLDAGLAEALDARRAGRVEPPPYDPRRDPATGLLNPTALRDYAHQLADTTGEVLDGGEVPIVLGGDCSILLGNLLALRRRGRHGLLFLDGHADFYQPEAEPTVRRRPWICASPGVADVVADLDGWGPWWTGRRRSDAEMPTRPRRRAVNGSGTPRSPSSTATVRDRGVRRVGDALAVVRPSSTASGSTATSSTARSCRRSTTGCRRAVVGRARDSLATAMRPVVLSASSSRF
jgi:hypothetical protein